MTEFYTVKNWEKFQHYKDRTPPWIKLHFEILTSSDWVMLADASKLLAIVCMLIASRNEGNVPSDPLYLKRVAYLDKTPDLTPLLKCGFLINPLADGSVMLADARPDTYSTDTDKKDISPNEDFEKDVWLVWPKKRRCSKPEALKAYREAIKKISPEKLRLAVSAYLRSDEAKINFRGEIFVPYPAKWLKSERWVEFESDSGGVMTDDKRAKAIAWKRDKGMIIPGGEQTFLEEYEAKHGHIILEKKTA